MSVCHFERYDLKIRELSCELSPGDPFGVCPPRPPDNDDPLGADHPPYTGDFPDDDDHPNPQDPRCACCAHALEAWRPYAFRTASIILGAAYTLFVAAITLPPTSVTALVCYGLIVLMLIGAGVAAYFGCAEARLVQESGGAHLVL